MRKGPDNGVARGKYIVATARNTFQIRVRNILNPHGYVFIGNCCDPVSLARMVRSYRPDFVITDTSMNLGRLRIVLDAISDDYLCTCIVVGEDVYTGFEDMQNGSNAIILCRGFNMDCLADIVDNAMVRFKAAIETNNKKRDIDESRKENEIVNTAKKLLMINRGIGEDEAYRVLRTRSMDMRIPIREVAESIIEVDGIKRR